jgi:hypothetical protein
MSANIDQHTNENLTYNEELRKFHGRIAAQMTMENGIILQFEHKSRDLRSWLW